MTRRLPRRRSLAMAALLAAPLLAGCGGSNRLETGYRYRPLGSTEVERRAFYADPFSKDALRGEQDEGPRDINPITGRR